MFDGADVELSGQRERAARSAEFSERYPHRVLPLRSAHTARRRRPTRGRSVFERLRFSIIACGSIPRTKMEPIVISEKAMSVAHRKTVERG
jgi:hypothetical protein